MSLRSLRELLKALRGAGFVANVTKIVSGAGVGQVAVLLASPLLTRLYAPEDFGVLAIYVSMFSLVVVFAGLRFEGAIPLPEEDSDGLALLVLAVGSILAVCVVLAIIARTFGAEIGGLVNAPDLGSHLWLVPLAVLAAGIYQVLSFWAIRMSAFHAIARTKLHQGLGMAVTQSVLGLVIRGPLGLLLGDVVGRAIGITTLVRHSMKTTDWKAVRALRLARLSEVAKRFKRFPLISAPSRMINAAGLDLPPIMLAAFFGTEVAGWFLLTQRLVGAPASLIGQAVAQVYLGEAATLVRQAEAGVRPLFFRTVKMLLLVGAPPILLLMLLGPWAFSVVFGTEWVVSGQYVRLTALMFLAQFVVVPVSETLNILERQDLQLWWDIGRLFASLGAILVAQLFGYSHLTAVFLYGAAMLAAYLALLLLVEFATRGR